MHVKNYPKLHIRPRSNLHTDVCAEIVQLEYERKPLRKGYDYQTLKYLIEIQTDFQT